MVMIVPVEEVYVEALQVKYPIIDCAFYIEESRKYWKIIRFGNHTKTYQIFADMLNKFDRDDLVKLWDLVKERFSTTEPIDDKEKELWVELKRLFQPDNDDTLWKLQKYMHDPLSDVDRTIPKIADESSKRAAEEELKQESSKKFGNHTKTYQIFADMLNKFDRDDLVKLWDLVKERFSTTEPIDDKEKELWVELKRLFQPGNDDTLWKLQKYMHDPVLYGAILHDELINEAIKDSKSYKEYYAIASGAKPPKTKASVKKKQARSDQAPKAKTSAKAAKPAKKKLPAKTSKAKGLTIGSGADKGTGDKPGVPDVPTYGSDDEQISWKSSEEEDDDEVGMSDDDANDDDDDDADNQEYNGQDDDNEQTNLNNGGDDFVYPKFSTHDQDEGKDEEDSFDPRVQTPSHVETTDDEDNDQEIQDVNVKGYELDKDEINKDDTGDELYRDVNVNLEGQDIEMTYAQQTNTVNEQVKAEVLTRSSNESKTSHVVAANLSKLELKKLLIDKIESNKSIHRSNEQKNLYKALVKAYESDKLILDTYGETVTFKRYRDDADKDEEPFARSNRGSKRRRARKEPESTTKPPSLDRDWNKTLPDVHGHVQPWLSSLAQMEDPRESFNELLDTPFDFTTFLMNQLKVDTLTPELLASPTFELMKGSCKSLVELEYFLEEVYKATTNQLDWNNPKGQQYPHDLCKPLPLIPNFRGRQVIPSDHFINNDLAYLSGGVSSVRRDNDMLSTFKEGDFNMLRI
nr:hypothetical protein [Tanacetum cinerariifolium]